MKGKQCQYSSSGTEPFKGIFMEPGDLLAHLLGHLRGRDTCWDINWDMHWENVSH